MKGGKIISSSPNDGLRSNAIKASQWTIFGFAISNVLRLISNPVLAYLLIPDVFAIITLASILIQGVRMFSDIGIGPVIIQHERGSNIRFLDTAWSIQIFRGFLLWVVILGLTKPIAEFYSDSRLLLIIPVLGLTTILSGFNSTSVFTASRNLHLGRFTVLGLTETIIKIIVMVIWALFSPTAWALVAGVLVSRLFFTVSTHFLLLGHCHRLRWEKEAASSIFNFGKWIFLSTVITFFALQLDKLLLGKIDSMGMLGVYGIAFTFASVPRQIVDMLAGKVLLPVLSTVARDKPEVLHQRIIQVRSIILPCGAVSILVLTFISPWFFQYFYKSEYWAASWITQLLGISIWFNILQSSSDRALTAIGNPKCFVCSNTVRVICVYFGCTFFYEMWGVVGFVLGVGMASVGSHLVIQFFMSYYGMSIFKQDFFYTSRFAIIIAIGYLIPDVIMLSLNGEFSTPVVKLFCNSVFIISAALWLYVKVIPQVFPRFSFKSIQRS